MKKKVFISILTVTVLCIWAINASAKGNPVKKLKVKDAKVVFCEAIPATMNGVCEVTTGDNSLLIKGNILGIHTVYQGGEVLVDASGLIQYVGCSSDRPADFDVTTATKIECAEGVVSPGLINPHDHLYFNHNYPFPATDERYDHRNDWRSDLMSLLRKIPTRRK